MEPADFDKLIANSLKGADSIHAKEMDRAKPFVWAAVQNNLKNHSSLRWYHLVAAIILLLVSFGFLLDTIRTRHLDEMSKLSSKLDQLEEHYLLQEKLLNMKNQQVSVMASELKEFQIKLASMEQTAPPGNKEVYIYRTDTVYLRQVEYVTVQAESSMDEGDGKTIVVEAKNTMQESAIADDKFDQVIYPSFAHERSKQKREPMKVKFGNTRTISN